MIFSLCYIFEASKKYFKITNDNETHYDLNILNKQFEYSCIPSVLYSTTIDIIIVHKFYNDDIYLRKIELSLNDPEKW